MSDLKPCPFCGYVAEIMKGNYDGENTSYVRCKKCWATSAKYESEKLAIEAWNRRKGAQE